MPCFGAAPMALRHLLFVNAVLRADRRPFPCRCTGPCMAVVAGAYCFCDQRYVVRPDNATWAAACSGMRRVL